MTTTINPATVTTGTVTISAASKAKRDALIGRHATFKTYSDGTLTGVIESIDGMAAIIRFADGRWAYSGRTVTLV